MPCVAHGEAKGECEEGIDTHARSLCEGQLSHKGDEQCTNGRSQRGCGEDCALIHASGREDVGVYGKNVAHGEEGGETCHQLRAEIVLGGIEAHETIKELHTRSMVDW